MRLPGRLIHTFGRTGRTGKWPAAREVPCETEHAAIADTAGMRRSLGARAERRQCPPRVEAGVAYGGQVGQVHVSRRYGPPDAGSCPQAVDIAGRTSGLHVGAW